MGRCFRGERQTYSISIKPVHPRAVRHHGLFGSPFVAQHMMFDDKWTPNSVMEEFQNMKDLLTRQHEFFKTEAQSQRRKRLQRLRSLRSQVRDARKKLGLIHSGANQKEIRNILMNHPHMQRLYEKLPVDQAVEKIDQQSFVLRKERDRLRYRAEQLKEILKAKEVERAALQDRITYETFHNAELDGNKRSYRKRLANSAIRLEAVKTINNTYKKMIQVLRHDEIFYEPILKSLSKDTDDQAKFIKHVLDIGTPAIARYAEMSEQYRIYNERLRRSVGSRAQWVGTFKKVVGQRISALDKSKLDFNARRRTPRYTRETYDMTYLRFQAGKIEKTMKELKYATLCSHAREIFPRLKLLSKKNNELHKTIGKADILHKTMWSRNKCASLLEDVLIHNLNKDEIERLEAVQTFQKELTKIEDDTAALLKHIKKQGDIYVTLRFALWSLNEILRHVGKGARTTKIAYPNSYLNLPLLKFEMLNMRACAPDIYESNLDILLNTVAAKLDVLMNAYKPNITKQEEAEHRERYHSVYLESMALEEMDVVEEREEKRPSIKSNAEDTDDAADAKGAHSRKRMKSQSLKIVEENKKVDTY